MSGLIDPAYAVSGLNKRLREGADRLTGWTYKGDTPEPDPRRLLRDAADEIERLENALRKIAEADSSGPSYAWHRTFARETLNAD